MNVINYGMRFNRTKSINAKGNMKKVTITDFYGQMNSLSRGSQWVEMLLFIS